MSLLSASLALVWCAGFWMLSRDTRHSAAVTLTGACASLLAVGLAASTIWPQVRAGYPGDSYWSLTWVGHAGVLTISIVGLALVFLASAAKTRVLLRVFGAANHILLALLDILLGLLAYAVVLSLSPQAYYSLYRLLFPGLPQQSVIKSWLDLDRLHLVARLDATGSLAEHLSGIGFWAVVPFTLWLHGRAWRRP